jgi:hypothetical protein
MVYPRAHAVAANETGRYYHSSVILYNHNCMNGIFPVKRKSLQKPFSLLKKGSFPQSLTFAHFKLISDFISLRNGTPLRQRRELRNHFNFLRKKLSVQGSTISTPQLASFTTSTGCGNCTGDGPCNNGTGWCSANTEPGPNGPITVYTCTC